MDSLVRGHFQQVEKVCELDEGTWYRARQNSGAPVDVAVLTRPSEARLQEIQALHKARHPNLPELREILDLGGGARAVVFAAATGHSVKDRIAQGKGTVAEAIDWACRVGEAITVLHEVGVVHGDIQPAWIRLVPGRGPMLTGLLLNRSEGRKRGYGEGLATTLRYAPPEQLEGELTEKGDIFSVGAVLYHALTGRAPFDSQEVERGDVPETNAEEVRQRVLAGRVVPLAELRPDLRGVMAYAVDRALQSDPARRFANAEAFRKALRSALVVAPMMGRRPLSAPPAEDGKTPSMVEDESGQPVDPDSLRLRSLPPPVPARSAGRKRGSIPPVARVPLPLRALTPPVEATSQRLSLDELDVPDQAPVDSPPALETDGELPGDPTEVSVAVGAEESPVNPRRRRRTASWMPPAGSKNHDAAGPPLAAVGGAVEKGEKPREPTARMAFGADPKAAVAEETRRVDELAPSDTQPAISHRVGVSPAMAAFGNVATKPFPSVGSEGSKDVVETPTAADATGGDGNDRETSEPRPEASAQQATLAGFAVPPEPASDVALPGEATQVSKLDAAVAGPAGKANNGRDAPRSGRRRDLAGAEASSGEAGSLAALLEPEEPGSDEAVRSSASVSADPGHGAPGLSGTDGAVLGKGGGCTPVPLPSDLEEPAMPTMPTLRVKRPKAGLSFPTAFAASAMIFVAGVLVGVLLFKLAGPRAELPAPTGTPRRAAPLVDEVAAPLPEAESLETDEEPSAEVAENPPSHGLPEEPEEGAPLVTEPAEPPAEEALDDTTTPQATASGADVDVDVDVDAPEVEGERQQQVADGAAPSAAAAAATDRQENSAPATEPAPAPRPRLTPAQRRAQREARLRAEAARREARARARARAQARSAMVAQPRPAAPTRRPSVVRDPGF